MTDRQYGNDVPTGPIPVIPPQDHHEDAPASGRPPAIPAQRDTSTSGRSGKPVAWPVRSPRRPPWMWVLLALLAVLCVVVVIMLGLVGTAHAGLPSAVQVVIVG
jgi:hypothetical protein